MGLFNLFKKNGANNNEPNPEDTMLTLNERQKPTLKSDTKPPGQDTAPVLKQVQPAAPDVLLTPDPQMGTEQKTTYNFAEEPAPEPEPFSRENLSTKSLEKNIQTMPNVKKLVIPSNNEAMEQKVEPTDTVFAERVKLKQVDLAGKEKEEQPLAPETNFIPGEFIDLPVSFLIQHIDAQYLSPNVATLFDNTAKVRFTKDEILSIMAQGVFAVVGSALFARFPAGAASEKGKNTNDVLEFPLDKILTLVPPAWFAMQGQDNSLTESLSNMSNPFQDLDAPAPEEIPQQQVESAPAQSRSSSLFDSDDDLSVEVSEEDPEETTLDTFETMIQTSTPVIEENDPLETMVQTKVPEIEEESLETKIQLTAPTFEEANSLETMVQSKAPEPPPETNDNFLAVPASAIKTALTSASFANFPDSACLMIPRNRVLGSLAEGIFKLTAGEIDQFAGTSVVDAANTSQVVDIDLGLIMGLIPPEWFSIQGQDNSQNDILTNMRDVFDDSTFEEAAQDSEEEILDTVEVDKNTQEQAVHIEEEVEEEETVDVEEEQGSLITGGIFSKMDSLFDDEDEDDEEYEEEAVELEEELAVHVEEEEAIPPPVIEEEKAAPASFEERTKLVLPPIAQVPKVPLQEEEEDTLTDSLQTITINRAEEKIFDDDRAAREQARELENQIHKAAEMAADNTTQEFKEEDSSDDEPKIARDAGQVTYRPIADEAPELTDKSEMRPSTAPNGIDINRSNLQDLCRLHSAGEKLAQTLIEYRETNGDFKSINELINVPGVGTSVYRSLTGLRPSADLVGAERRINKVVGLSSEQDFSLGKIIKEAQLSFGFKSLILSDKDGFEICSSGDKSLLESNSELLAATTPQLFKKTRHFLKQSNLPHPEIFTFYLEDSPVTFGIADEVFMVMVHSSKWPEPKHMKQCRELINELAWFCSYRAIV